jgi:lipopolysaccharide/colanic/teichoic acid biosynthesis glycosyltransferase
MALTTAASSGELDRALIVPLAELLRLDNLAGRPAAATGVALARCGGVAGPQRDPSAVGVLRSGAADVQAVTVKRTFDFTVALLALTIGSPLILATALLVRIKLGAPVFFHQQRPGLYGRPFTMLKFRTMSDARGPDGALLPDAQRLPKFGQWLRATSLDELPGLINVLRGDMSLVGPRPLLMQYLPLYTPLQARRHEVRPGVTGWAQVNGRNALSWDEKFALDIWYVDHQSIALDMRILYLTAVKVLKKEGISGEGEATMAPFTGSSRTEEV